MKFKLNETKKEDDLYFNGCFWVIADSFEDIIHNKYTLLCNKYLVDFSGNEVSPTPKNSKTHFSVWENNFKSQYPGKSYTYYPRGRVNIYNGKVYINLNSKLMLNPTILDNIYKEYQLQNFKWGTDIETAGIDLIQGNHYDFELK